MTTAATNTALEPTKERKLKIMFRTNDDGLFNASSLAKEYGKDVYGYTRGQKTKDLVIDISKEYNHDPKLEFTDQGNIVRVISGGTTPGTWMHLDIFIKFLGWLDPKLERFFLKGAIKANQKLDIDPLQKELAEAELKATSLRRKLSRNKFYKDLQQTEKDINRLKREIEKADKSKRKNITDEAKKATLSLGNPTP